MKLELMKYYQDWQKDCLNGIGLNYTEWLEHKHQQLKEEILEKLNTAMEYYENDKFSTRAKSMKNYIDEAIEILNDEND